MPGRPLYQCPLRRGKGGETQISQQRGRSWHPPRFPKGTSTNKHAEPKGTDLLLSKISAVHQGVRRKQEGSKREAEEGEEDTRLGPDQMGTA